MIPKRNLAMLMNLSYYGFNRGLDGDFKPIKNAEGSWTTHCNQFINFVLNGMGYDLMTGMNANQMILFMSTPKNGWISVSDDIAQQHANCGVIVIAGNAHLGGHGHVNLIIPGILEKSGEYGKAVPKCVNVGKDVFFGKKVSFAFRSSEEPTYYCLAGMI
jgi:hypothetical protein